MPRSRIESLLDLIFTLALADEEKRLVPKSMITQLRSEAVSWFIGGAIFWSPPRPYSESF